MSEREKDSLSVCACGVFVYVHLSFFFFEHWWSFSSKLQFRTQKVGFLFLSFCLITVTVTESTAVWTNREQQKRLFRSLLFFF